MTKYKPISKTDLEKFPKDLIIEIKDTLKVYDECNVYFENNKYYASAGIGIYNRYAPDYKFIGVAYVDDIFTLEERTQNYLESFHDYPGWYVGKRDYKWLRETYGDFAN